MMDLSPDLWFLLPAVLFTLIAVVTGALLLRKNAVSKPSTSSQNCRTAPDNRPGECALPRPQRALSHSRETEDNQELLSGKGSGSESTAHTAQDLEEEKHCKLLQTNAASKCETPVPVKKVGQQDKPLRYMPGMLRTSQLEKMMSKEELEEERRVQREQLTAIFKLLKENQDAFGEVTEHDMEEQLKLYSI